VALPKKPSEQLRLIRPAINSLADDYYKGDSARAFLHWGIREMLFEDDLSDEVIAEKLIIDGPDDLGVDAFWVDDESKVVHLFQSKYLSAANTILPRSDVDTFIAAPARLLDPDMVTKSKNEGVKELNEALVSALESEFTVNLIFLTTGDFAAKDRDYFQRNSVMARELSVNGKMLSIRLELNITDLPYLTRLWQEHLNQPAAETSARFQLVQGQFHEVRGEYRVLDFTVPAMALVSIFDEFKYEIFRLNPRGPLIRSKINRAISKSLEEPATSHLFNVLNNGITAICDSWTREGTSVSARNFQIVNGCQTTVALSRAKARVRADSSVQVDVKLVECPEVMHAEIARATNTQNRLKYEDFVSTDRLQLQLQQEFRSLNPPWFCEVKRGEWGQMIDKREKARYQTDGGNRVLTVKEVAQAALAFLGKPGEAKDKPRLVFEKKLASPDGMYDEVFVEGITAQQLLLPASVYRRVLQEVGRTESAPDWLSYARLHILWLLGELVRTRYGIQGRLLPSKERSAGLTSGIESWFQRLYPVARDAVGDLVSEARRTPAFKGLRELFRSSDRYPLFKERFESALERWKVTGRQVGLGDPLESLP